LLDVLYLIRRHLSFSHELNHNPAAAG
jgi:hypothetical protein